MPINLTITAENVVELRQALRDLADLTIQSNVTSGATASLENGSQAAAMAPAPTAQAATVTPALTPVPAIAPAPVPVVQEPAVPVTQTSTAPPAAPAPTQAPTATPRQAPTAVPTVAQTYTLDQLAVAATQLVDAGRREELVALLGQFGVQALTALPKEQYGAFATALRQMGAKI